MDETNDPDCPYDYVPGKSLLSDFALANNPRLLYMRVLHRWYFEAVELGLEAVPVYYPANDIFVSSEKDGRMLMDFEDLQFLFRQKMLELSQMTLWCL